MKTLSRVRFYFRTFLLTGFFIGLGCLVMKAQAPMVALPSPNAASLGTFGQIPVSSFTGVPNISIPLYTAQDGALSVPISLNYHTSLVKPEHIPGWVGLGWSLSPGGSITRISKGTNLYDENNTSFSEQPSYLYRRSLLGSIGWSSESSVLNLANPPNNSDGYPTDFEPDEFSFNFGNYSGTFYLNHEGDWKVRSQSPLQLKVVPVLSDRTSFLFNGFYILDRYYESFSVITEDGTEYFFGNDLSEAPIDSDNPVAIEFSVNATRGVSQDGASKTLIPTTWLLSKIISPEGHIIKFEYKRGGGLHTMTKYVTLTEGTYKYNLAQCESFFKFRGCYEASFNHTTFRTRMNVELTYPSYLDKIILSDNSQIKFSTSISNQLDYDPNEVRDSKPNDFQIGPFSTSEREKLDNIIISDPDGNLIQRFDFTYTDNPSSRLFLDKLEETGRNGERKKFQFTYDNTIPLPGYNSGAIDHWGYYIGGNYFNNLENMLETRSVNTVNAPLMQRGILTKIKYPTGGSTKLEFEAHAYSSVVSRNPLGIEGKNANLLTGGLRIRKIKSFDENDQIVSEKEYFYVKDFINGGNLSSGVLAGEPSYMEYWDLGTEKWISFSDRIIQPLSYTSGSHITYSEVVERETANGYKVYKFSNSDDARYRDKEPHYSTPLANNTKSLLPFNSLAYTRGNIVAELFYDETKNLQRAVSYNYNIQSPGATDAESVRAVFIRPFIEDKVFSAYAQYTFCPYLVRKTTTDYDKNGQNPVSYVVNYSYSSNKQLKSESHRMSDGTQFITTFKYPLDYSVDESSVEIARMKELHIVGPPIEKVILKEKFSERKVLEGEYQEFKQFHANVLKPWKIYRTSFEEPVSFGDFNLTHPKTISAQHISLVVDNCCSNMASEPFTINSVNAGQKLNATLSLYFQNESPSHGNFTVNLAGPVNQVFKSFTMQGNNNDGVYAIEFTTPLNLAPGNYTIELSYAGSSDFYGRCDLDVKTLGEFQHLEPKTVFNFDDAGKLIEIKPIDDFPTSYIWGYNNKSLLIARIVNATQEEVYLEDFESYNGADKGTAHTGHFFKQGDFTVNFSPPNGKIYSLSYWYYDSDKGKWEFSGILNYVGPTADLSLGSGIDDIRIYPSDSQITTFTHDPLIGATSITDANNTTTYYEYDGLNRLIGIKDFESNYVKKYEYHYRP